MICDACPARAKLLYHKHLDPEACRYLDEIGGHVTGQLERSGCKERCKRPITGAYLLLIPRLRNEYGQLPKLDVVGSNPIARFFRKCLAPRKIRDCEVFRFGGHLHHFPPMRHYLRHS